MIKEREDTIKNTKKYILFSLMVKQRLILKKSKDFEQLSEVLFSLNRLSALK